MRKECRRGAEGGKRREVERRRDGTPYIRGNRENERYSGGETAESGRGVGGRG